MTSSDQIGSGPQYAFDFLGKIRLSFVQIWRFRECISNTNLSNHHTPQTFENTPIYSTLPLYRPYYLVFSGIFEVVLPEM